MKARRSRGEIIASIEATRPWSNVHTSMMSESSRAVFDARKKAVDMYVDGELIEDIFKYTNIPSSDLRRYTKRCMSICSDGMVAGYRALIPHFRIASYERVAPMESFDKSGRGGYAGALGALFRQYPDLKQFLIHKIIPGKSKKVPNEINMKPKALFAHFIKFLKHKDHPADEWPLNVEYQGYRTVAEFLKEVKLRNFDAYTSISGSAEAVAHLSVGRGIYSILKLDGFLDIFEIDSHKIDAHFVVGMKNGLGLTTYVRLKRINLIAVVEKATSATWWMKVVYSPEVSSHDIVQIITECLRDKLPKPHTNNLNLTLPDGTGYPTELFPALKGSLPSSIFFDNALAHQATVVSSELRKLLGVSLCYGAPAKFEIRPNVERAFKEVAAHMKRMPNRASSKPGEGAEGIKAAVEYHIEADEIEELLYYHHAMANGLPSEGKGGLSPLGMIKQYLERNNGNYIPRSPIAAMLPSIAFKKTIAKVKVVGYLAKGVRGYVQIDRVRYKSEVLSYSTWLIGQTLTVEIDESDMRSVEAFLPDGAPLGRLTATGGWEKTKHTRRTRKAINKLVRDRMLIIAHSDDPVVAFLQYQEKKAQSLQMSKEKIVQTPNGRQDAGAASAYKKALHESGIELPPPSEPVIVKPRKPSVQPVLDPTKSYDSVVPDTALNIKNLFK
jgi:hypothetical protein